MEKFKLNHPDYFKVYYENNKEKLKNYHAEWVKENKENVKKYQREYQKKYIKKYRKEKRFKEQNDKIEAFKATLSQDIV